MGASVLGSYLAIVAACVGCSPKQVVSTPKVPDPVHDVGWTVMIRDYTTADIYTGRKVRIRVDRDDYKTDGQEVRIWLTQGAFEPVIVCHTWEPVPKDEGRGVLITGVSKGPVRDGKWRSLRVDYFVRLENCVVTAR